MSFPNYNASVSSHFTSQLDNAYRGQASTGDTLQEGLRTQHPHLEIHKRFLDLIDFVLSVLDASVVRSDLGFLFSKSCY